jgi:hypothetical protein
MLVSGLMFIDAIESSSASVLGRNLDDSGFWSAGSPLTTPGDFKFVFVFGDGFANTSGFSHLIEIFTSGDNNPTPTNTYKNILKSVVEKIVIKNIKISNNAYTMHETQNVRFGLHPDNMPIVLIRLPNPHDVTNSTAGTINVAENVDIC